MLPSNPPSVRNEFQLKFFLSGRLSVTTTRKLVAEYRAQQQAVLTQYQVSEKALREAIKAQCFPEEILALLNDDEKPLTPKQRAKQLGIFLLTLRQGVLAVEARIKWSDEAMEFLKKDSISKPTSRTT